MGPEVRAQQSLGRRLTYFTPFHASHQIKMLCLTHEALHGHDNNNI